MANTSRPAGLSPVGYLNGAAYNGQARLYFVPSTNTTAFAIGDPVDLAGSADTNGVPSIALANAGSQCIGAVVGVGENEGTVANINTPNSIIAPATKTRPYYLMVADDPATIFQIQESGTALAAANVGQNANFVSGANNGYVSGYQLDNSTTETTTTLSLKLLGLARKPDNAFGTYAKWLVMINSHRYRSVGQPGV
jgi:hypothetical protein